MWGFYNCNLVHVGLVKAILASCMDFMWETVPRGAGLRVFNAYTNEWMTIWMVIARIIEDTVGLPKPLCCHKQPALIGWHIPLTPTFLHAHISAHTALLWASEIRTTAAPA